MRRPRAYRPLRFESGGVIDFLKVLAVSLIGLALGLVASAYALREPRPFGGVRLGPWEVTPGGAAAQTDVYAHASLERSGELPLAVGEGLQLIAREDDDGRPLDGRCVYRVGARAPAARYWTLSLVSPEGFPVENPAQRYGFRSSEILRAANGSFAVAVSQAPQAGNWLPVGRPGRFALALRLYDSPLAATVGDIDKEAAPKVTRIGCG
ncbi:MAG: DUF1214 domain-containing protein [Hyphomicrobiales bacterium]|nr:DUF1214 domain-containing protein [Hyphomicrobiales bacterium]